MTSLGYQKTIDVRDRYDVVVCGGGPSGIPAALAVARAGHRVLLVEQTGQCGGVGTSAGVSHLLGGRLPDNSAWTVAGIFKEVVERLAARGGAINPCDIECEKGTFSPHGWTGKVSSITYGVPFDPHAMAALLDELLLEARVDVLYFTAFVDARVEAEEVKQLILFNKSGLFAVEAKLIVDATGDADVAARSGCEFVKGRDSDGGLTPATLMFHVDRVDDQILSNYINTERENRFRKLIQDLRDRNIWTFPYDIFISVQLNEPGTYMINTTRICDVDGTDGKSLSKGMMRGRAEMQALFAIMKAHLPGFKNARIRFVAPQLGIRETRRIVGEYLYTVDDLLLPKDFEDTVAYSGYPFDLPDPQKPSHQPMNGVRLKRAYTPIPYAIMLPRPVRNVICPGRAVSVERDVLGPLREMGPCYGMGHAAGLAASLALQAGCGFEGIDRSDLRKALRDQGAVVDL